MIQASSGLAGALSSSVNMTGSLDSSIQLTSLVSRAKGDKGDKGDDGRDGIDGRDGTNGTNGRDGRDGTNGRDGIDGINGQDGASAFEIAVAHGFIGTEAEWLESLARAYDDTEIRNLLNGKADSNHNHDGRYLTEHQSLDGKADADHNHDGRYLREHQSLENYALRSELPTVPTSDISANTVARHSHTNKTVLDGITSDKVTEWNNKSTFDGNYNSLANKPTIPAAVTDEHINSLIDAKLGVIENGSY